jgi:hypothetical protein
MGLAKYIRQASASPQQDDPDEILVTARKLPAPVEMSPIIPQLFKAAQTLVQAPKPDYAANEEYIRQQISDLTSQMNMMKLMSLISRQNSSMPVSLNGTGPRFQAETQPLRPSFIGNYRGFGG